jgi:putative nucleotidyltransferase with HDIG domain
MPATPATLDALDCIKPLPQVALRVIQITTDPDYDATELYQAVNLDQAVTASVLQLVNSTAYALRNPVSSLEHALRFLGPRNLSRMVLGVCSTNVVQQDGLPQEEKERIWKHAVAVAVASAELANASGCVAAEPAFTAGLLHDVGRAAIAYSDLVSEGPPDFESGRSWLDREREVAGVDHDELGGILLERWKLPAELQVAVRHHSDPSAIDDAGEARLAAALHLAEVRCSGMGLAAFEEGREAPLCVAATEILGVGGEELGKVWPRVEKGIQKAEGLLNLQV